MPAWTWTITPEVVGIAVLCVGDGANFLSALNPSIFTIRTFRSSKFAVEAEETGKDIVRGTIGGVTLGLAVGLAASAVTRSWIPVVGTALGLAAVVAFYAWALMHPRGRVANMSAQAA